MSNPVMKTTIPETIIPDTIRSAKAVLRGRLALAGTCAEIHREDIASEWMFNLFEPERQIQVFSEPGFRHHFRNRDVSITAEEERAVTAEPLGELGVELAERFYREAAKEALSVLMQLSQENPYHSVRLCARVCAAVRTELAALVEEWEAVSTAGGLASKSHGDAEVSS